MESKVSMLSIKDLHVRFGDTMVLKGLNLEVNRGDIHAVVGQNAVGKSTLVHVISGMIQPVSGRIEVEGKPLSRQQHLSSNQSDILTIFQHIAIFNNLTVLDNVFMRDMDRIYNAKKLVVRYHELEKQLDITIRYDAMVGTLSEGVKRMIELMIAYVCKPKLLILDELSSFFSTGETKLMNDILLKIRNQGTTILYITQKIPDALSIADKVSILYDGLNIKTFENGSMETEAIIELMAGKPSILRYPKMPVIKGSSLFTVNKVANHHLKDISFTLHQGEILGIVGTSGSGKTLLSRTLIGQAPMENGHVFFHPSGSVVTTTAEALRFGIGYIGEDSENNLIPGFTASCNITLTKLEKVLKYHVLSCSEEDEVGSYYSHLLNIPSLLSRKSTCFFSGGEKQKICFSKLLFSDAHVIIVDEPTKFVDVTTKSDIYNLIGAYVSKGNGIIIMTSDFSEACGICDMIFVLNEGQIVAKYEHKDATEQKIIDTIFKNSISQ